MKIAAFTLKKLRTKKAARITGLVIGVFILVNLVIFVSFKDRTFPNQTVGSKPIGSISYSALESKINQLGLLPKKVVLSAHGQNYVYSASALGVEANSSLIIQRLKHKSWLPLLNLFGSHNVAFSETVNVSKLNGALSLLTTTSKQNPVNASVVLADDQFTLSPAQSGYQIDLNGAMSQISNAISQGQNSINLAVATIAPAVSNTAATKTLDQLMQAEKDSLSFTYLSSSARPTAQTIANWYSLNGTAYSLNTNLISNYIDRFGSKNNIIVANLTSAVNAAVSALNSDKPLSFTLQAEPPSVCNTNKQGQLVIVSITQQHMWACQGPEQVYDTPVTTGAYLNGDYTPTGTWHIFAKERDVNLIGPTWDDFVQYWMPFYSDYGFHDASWQTFPFGGPEYPQQGSHGCVHLPLSAMAWLFNWASIGTTVTINQ